ncbi:molybdopterin-binding protein [Sphingobium sp. Sx8-8]|uniref:molybdopterin-binding protein n=1 Tax=Sphingobium sp. Sx8-8 TaxID=2933617 RepID=UPI001F5AF208|nr:molybdopterin-binding protein [Sphingobium sp. Sx8-8]
MVIIPTGDELIAAPVPRRGQIIHDGNGPMIAAQAREAGIEACLARPVGDDADAMLAAIRAAIDHRPSLIVSTGGVSVGQRDCVVQALNALGAKIHFHGVLMRPGKPILFATLPGGILYFGLPGNPVSAYLGFRLFVFAALRAMQGMGPEAGMTFATEYSRRPGITLFLRCKVTWNSDGCHVHILGHQQSHRMRPLVEANFWLVLPPAQEGEFTPALFRLSPTISS